MHARSRHGDRGPVRRHRRRHAIARARAGRPLRRCCMVVHRRSRWCQRLFVRRTSDADDGVGIGIDPSLRRRSRRAGLSCPAPRPVAIGAIRSWPATCPGCSAIGGGVVTVPLMHLVMRAPITVAMATSNFMLGITGGGRGIRLPLPRRHRPAARRRRWCSASSPALAAPAHASASRLPVRLAACHVRHRRGPTSPCRWPGAPSGIVSDPTVDPTWFGRSSPTVCATERCVAIDHHRCRLRARPATGSRSRPSATPVPLDDVRDGGRRGGAHRHRPARCCASCRWPWRSAAAAAFWHRGERRVALAALLVARAPGGQPDRRRRSSWDAELTVAADVGDTRSRPRGSTPDRCHRHDGGIDSARWHRPIRVAVGRDLRPCRGRPSGCRAIWR